MNYYEAIMTDAEKQSEIGVLTEQLSQCIANLNRERKNVHILAPSLRVIADCFDQDLPEVKVDQVHEHGFTFQDARDQSERHKFPPSHQRYRTTQGENSILIEIPNGTALFEIIGRIQDLSQEAASLNARLLDLGVDVNKISESLRG